MERENAVIVAIGRSAITKGRKGSFAHTHPVDFAAQVLRGTLDQIPQLNDADIDDVIVGCAMPYHEQADNVARLIAQRAGLPDRVPGQTVNRFCSSGLQAIASCANAIMSGEADIMVAGGVEAMSLLPIGTDPKYHNEWLNEHIPGTYMSMGLTAENVGGMYHITREQMDAFAADSHHKAAAAQTSGFFEDQIIPVTVTDDDGTQRQVTQDEGIRPDCTPESLGALKPCFKADGAVTAATSSQVSDGAGFTVLMSERKARQLGIIPIARFLGFAVEGVPSHLMGLGPIGAVKKVMDRTGFTVDDMDVIELNEAFAAQALPCIQELHLPTERVNPEGGAIALGHPLGATGVILTCKAISHLRRTGGRYGLITMCIGGGMGAAAIIKLCR